MKFKDPTNKEVVVASQDLTRRPSMHLPSLYSCTTVAAQHQKKSSLSSNTTPDQSPTFAMNSLLHTRQLLRRSGPKFLKSRGYRIRGLASVSADLRYVGSPPPPLPPPPPPEVLVLQGTVQPENTMSLLSAEATLDLKPALPLHEVRNCTLLTPARAFRLVCSWRKNRARDAENRHDWHMLL